MTPETFCEQFATFAEAPNGVAKLRELILQLAVQGKLGTQDVNDEPVSVQPHGIEPRKRKSVASAGDDDPSEVWPFEVPPTWRWIRLRDTPVELKYGTSVKCDYGGNGVPVLRIPNVVAGRIDTEDLKYGDLTDKEQSDLRLEEGNLLLIRSNGSTGIVGRTAVVDQNAIGFAYAGYLVRLRFSKLTWFPDFLHLAMISPATRDQIEGPIRTTSGVKNINSTEIGRLMLPLPPLAEQRRIVGKVDQLLGLCDELAARQAARREARERLVGATLDRLVSARSAAEFPAHAHRLRDHFDRLFDTPTTLPQLRQAILQLAVQGQLVPQDPNDEPAEVLLEKIRLEKSRLMETVKVKADESLHRKAKVAPPDYHPPGWKWVRFHEVIWCFRGHNPPKCDFVSSPRAGYVRFIQITDFKTDSKAVYVPIMKNLKMVHRGEIIMAAYRHIGKVSREMEGAFNVALCKVNEIAPMDRDFVELLIGTDLVKGELLSESERGHIPSMHSDHLLSLWVPVPPLSEQKRIVSKVTELLSLCDALEAKLTQAESASTQLLSAAVHHLLNSPHMVG